MLQPANARPNPFEEHGQGLTGTEDLVPDRRVKMIDRIITDANIPQTVDGWRADACKSNAGRTAELSLKAVIVVFLILAVEGSPLLITTGATLLHRRLSPESRARLGIDDNYTWTQWYHMLQKGLTRLIALADPKPAKYQRKMTRAQMLANREARDPESSAAALVRLDWLCNQLLYATIAACPGVLDGWEGNITIDGTAYPVFSKHGQTKNSLYASIESDAAFYMRDSRHKETTDRSAARKVMFGYELHLVAPAANISPDPGTSFAQPVMGISQCQPSESPSTFGLSAITSAMSRFGDRMRGGLVIADKGYFANAKAEDLALPVRAMGMGILTDYKKDQTGVVDGYAGAELIEGTFYCPGMPEALKSATKDERYDRIEPDVWLKRIDGRAPYVVRRKAKPDADGYTPMMCPAAGPNATVICPLKPKDASRNSGKSLLPIMPVNLPEHPDKICTQTSVVFPPTAGAKFRQDLRYATAAWFRLYRSGRNFIESTNAYIKDEGKHALAVAGRRRARGHSKQYFLATTLVFAANLQRINSHLWNEANPLAPDRTRRRDKLNNYRWDPTTRQGTAPNGLFDGYQPAEAFDDDLDNLETCYQD
ncbi:hypothetical protein JOE58_002569 [Curtobacterium luteum]|uniref:Transposase IS4-like domain-containing protein n=1 Tax=Curtobacterium luteum TaxID=33881 RepID=A0ABS2RX95_9MICO|nr:hypothetical protein [Curtobacterium luteum]MBM7803318.1 hypothetical protein [Curtobacterium luteum]NUU51649.1 hypothetical protein [Curtobacterium luteum]